MKILTIMDDSNFYGMTDYGHVYAKDLTVEAILFPKAVKHIFPLNR